MGNSGSAASGRPGLPFFALGLTALLYVPTLYAAGAKVEVCFNYGCKAKAIVEVSGARLGEIGRLFGDVQDAETERRAVAQAVGLFERIAGEQTPTHNDRGGNLADEGVEGRTDCIDNSRNTTTWLRLVEREGWLRHHEVGERVRRWRFFFEHWAATLVEKGNGERYAVDSWFFDNGQPAWVVAFEDWQRGARPE